MSDREEERIYRRVLGHGLPKRQIDMDTMTALQSLMNEFLLRRIPIVLTSREVEEEVSPESLEQKIDSLNKRISVLEDRMTSAEQHLKTGFEPKKRALTRFRDMISKIPEIRYVFYRETEDGFDILTLFESNNRFETLQKIVQVQIKLDKSYKDVFFGFNTFHVADVDKEEFENWKQLYRVD